MFLVLQIQCNMHLAVCIKKCSVGIQLFNSVKTVTKQHTFHTFKAYLQYVHPGTSVNMYTSAPSNTLYRWNTTIALWQVEMAK